MTPGWAITAVLAIAFSYFAFTTLAPWQLNKDEDIVARNHQIEAAYEADPVPITQVMEPGGAIDATDEWTRVTAQGQFLGSDEVLLRMRPVDKAPSFQSLTPFRLTTGETILVHRGWVWSGDGTTVPEINTPPTGQVTVTGMVRLNEPTVDKQPLVEQGYQQVYSINTQQIGELTGQELGEDYLMLSADSPGVLEPMPVPTLDRGSHLSYGLQWLAFGVMAPLGVILLARGEVKERRRAREEEAQMQSVVAGEFDEDAWLASDPDTEVKQVTRSRSVRDRYGESKRDHYSKLGRRQRERF